MIEPYDRLQYVRLRTGCRPIVKALVSVSSKTSFALRLCSEANVVFYSGHTLQLNKNDKFEFFIKLKTYFCTTPI